MTTTPIGMSPPIPAASPSPGMWVPLALAERWMDCYYGGGPRHNERHPRPAPEPAPRSEAARDGRGPPAFTAAMFSGVSDIPRGAKPGGILARNLHPGGPSAKPATMGGDSADLKE